MLLLRDVVAASCFQWFLFCGWAYSKIFFQIVGSCIWSWLVGMVGCFPKLSSFNCSCIWSSNVGMVGCFPKLSSLNCSCFLSSNVGCFPKVLQTWEAGLGPQILVWLGIFQHFLHTISAVINCWCGWAISEIFFKSLQLYWALNWMVWLGLSNYFAEQKISGKNKTCMCVSDKNLPQAKQVPGPLNSKNKKKSSEYFCINQISIEHAV